MRLYSYDSRYSPPAPILPVQVSSPVSSSSVTLDPLVDTGADMTVVPLSMVRNLGLPRLYFTRSRGFGGAIEHDPVFSAVVTVESLDSQPIRTVSWEEEYVLLGRDVLSHWQVHLDGPGQTLTISR